MNRTAQSQLSLYKKGFTLVELLVVMGIIGVLLAVSSLLLLNLIPKASLTTQAEKLVAELRNQQLRAMTGQVGSAGTVQSQGMYFTSDRYVLFSGASYNVADPENFEIILDQPLQIESTLLNQQVVFLAGSGEIDGYDSTQDRITIRNPSSNESVSIEFNQYGIIDVN